MIRRPLPSFRGSFLCAVALGCGLAALGQEALISLDRPGDREFIVDRAGLIDETGKSQIQTLCDALLTDLQVPIIVVTVESMAQYGPGNLRIETFARLLFDQWGIGYKDAGGQSWNRGILLVVSAQDRQARIELGADWGLEFNPVCTRIMDEHIVFHFRQGDYTGGIVAGVQGLDKMARGQRLPTRPRPWWHYALVAGAIVLGVFTVVSLIRRGASGWAWVFWGVVFSILGFLLYAFLTSSRHRSGGFSGGSFGGGFSGGGGATGSW